MDAVLDLRTGAAISSADGVAEACVERFGLSPLDAKALALACGEVAEMFAESPALLTAMGDAREVRIEVMCAWFYGAWRMERTVLHNWSEMADPNEIGIERRTLIENHIRGAFGDFERRRAVERLVRAHQCHLQEGDCWNRASVFLRVPMPGHSGHVPGFGPKPQSFEQFQAHHSALRLGLKARSGNSRICTAPRPCPTLPTGSVLEGCSWNA